MLLTYVLQHLMGAFKCVDSLLREALPTNGVRVSMMAILKLFND